MNCLGFFRMVLEKTKKLYFPGLLLAFELLIIILFALLVEYDEGGQPGHEETVAAQLAGNQSTGKEADDYLLQLQSTRSTTKVYPCTSAKTLHDKLQYSLVRSVTYCAGHEPSSGSQHVPFIVCFLVLLLQSSKMCMS